jgi:phosphoribosylamine--glycine ligase
LPILEGDLLELLYSAAKGKIKKDSIRYDGKTAVCVVAASNGYPDKYEKGFEIQGIEEVEKRGGIVFHAGTKLDNEKLVTNGGRVLAVTAVVDDNDIQKCKKIAYEYISEIEFDGIHYRKDISDKAFL